MIRRENTLKLITETTEDVKVITEAREDGKKDYYIEGIFLQSNLKNHNGRIYPKEIMEREVKRYITQYINTGRAMGELTHPKSCQINPDRVSHRIVSLKESGNNYIGKAKILDTPCGRTVKGLLEGGVQLGVSSRGMGSLRERSDGAMEVGGDFTLATAADIVTDPSGPDCFVNGILEGVEWVFVDGHYEEKHIDATKQLIEQASVRDLKTIKMAAFTDFINKISSNL